MNISKERSLFLYLWIFLTCSLHVFLRAGQEALWASVRFFCSCHTDCSADKEANAHRLSRCTKNKETLFIMTNLHNMLLKYHMSRILHWNKMETTVKGQKMQTQQRLLYYKLSEVYNWVRPVKDDCQRVFYEVGRSVDYISLRWDAISLLCPALLLIQHKRIDCYTLLFQKLAIWLYLFFCIPELPSYSALRFNFLFVLRVWSEMVYSLFNSLRWPRTRIFRTSL